MARAPAPGRRGGAKTNARARYYVCILRVPHKLREHRKEGIEMTSLGHCLYSSFYFNYNATLERAFLSLYKDVIII